MRDEVSAPSCVFTNITKELENMWEGSIAAHDASFLQSGVASDFVGIYSNGKFINKSGLISAEIKSNTNSYTPPKTRNLMYAYLKRTSQSLLATREKGYGQRWESIRQDLRFH